MRIARRPLRRALSFCATVLFLTAASFAQAPQKARVDDYQIEAELVPRSHRLIAKAAVKVTALEQVSILSFDLHNGLRVTKLTDEAGKALSPERVTQDSAIRVALVQPLEKGTTTTFNFEYEGVLQNADDSPVEGLKLAGIDTDTSYLLYAGRWFPVMGYGINRFTSSIKVTVPVGYRVIGSGSSGAPAAAAAPPAPAQPATTRTTGKAGSRTAVTSPPPAAAQTSNTGKTTYSFTWNKPSFPGTIIAGYFDEAVTRQGGITVRTYLKPAKKEFAAATGETAGKQVEFFSGLYGPAPSTTINVVELPDDTVPSAWAPEIAGIASRAITDKLNYRLLANALSHQWWGVSVSPAAREDHWMTEGFARYSEVRYVQATVGNAGFEEATRDMSVGALAYDNVPLSSAGKLDVFSPEYQSLATDKGGTILHMLRWVIGEANFDKSMLTFATRFANKPASLEDFRSIAENLHGEKLTAFFAQWLDGTGAPEFHNKYSVFRIPKGFRVVGEITQDLDLFRMPLEVRVDTDGQTEMKRIEVVGTRSAYTIETFGKPRRITLDPNNWVLKNSDDLKVRVAILRGQQLVAQGDLTEALKEYNKALEANKASSLAHYRIAEVFFLQRNYQASANAYREALNGDGEPKWTEVWSHIQLGKIFDATGQRERATNEYRQALQTNDNTQGALDEARKYLQAPYQRERNSNQNGN